MADDANNADGSAGSGDDSKPTSRSIRELVGERLKLISPAVAESVVEHFVQKETQRRVDLISSALDRLDGMIREGYKLKADNEVFDEGGKLISSGFSKGRLEERRKHQEKVDKLTKAIDKALNGDVKDLSDLMKNG